jgi:hypothetical protein
MPFACGGRVAIHNGLACHNDAPRYRTTVGSGCPRVRYQGAICEALKRCSSTTQSDSLYLARLTRQCV